MKLGVKCKKLEAILFLMFPTFTNKKQNEQICHAETLLESTNKGTFSLTHQYINTFYNTYRLHVSAYYSHLRACVIRALSTIGYLLYELGSQSFTGCRMVQLVERYLGLKV